MINFGAFWKTEACGQIVLPYRSLSIGQKMMENAKLENYKCDFLGDFQTLWKMSQFVRMIWSFDIWSILNQTLCFFQLIGCMIIGYMAWVLSTSVTVSRFLDGTLVRYPNDHMSCHIICWNRHFCIFQIFTYVVIGLGFTLFFSGLIGWVGGASESPCLVRLFLFSVVVSMIAEIGGIISLNIVRLEVHTVRKSQIMSENSISKKAKKMWLWIFVPKTND